MPTPTPIYLDLATDPQTAAAWLDHLARAHALRLKLNPTQAPAAPSAGVPYRELPPAASLDGTLYLYKRPIAALSLVETSKGCRVGAFVLEAEPPPSAALVRAQTEARRDAVARSTTATAVGGAALCFAFTLFAFSVVLPIALVLGGAGVAMIAAGHEAKTEAEAPPQPTSRGTELATRHTRALMDRLWLKHSLLAEPTDRDARSAIEAAGFLDRFLAENASPRGFSQGEAFSRRFSAENQA